MNEDSHQIERAVLSIFFVRPELLDVTAIRAEHFTSPICKAIFQAMQFLRGKGMVINAITIHEHIKAQPIPDDLKSFAQVCEIEGHPLAADEAVLKSYEQIIISAWQRRHLAASHEKARIAIEDGEDPDEVQERFERDTQAALEAGSERPYLIRVEDFANYFSPAEALIDRFLFRGSKTLVFGPSGIGKTKIAINEACPIAEHANVVWVAAERPDEVADAVDAWRHHHKKEVSGFHLREEPVYLLQSESIATFIRKIKSLDPVAIFIDPWANCLAGGNESGTEHTIFAVEGLNRIIRETGGPAVLIIHHTGWNDAHERGSYALRTGCKVVGKVALSDDTLFLSCEKSNTKPFELMKFRLTESLNSVVALPTDQTIRDDKLSHQQHEALVKMAYLAPDQCKTLKELVTATETPKSTLSRHLYALRRRGLIERDSYALTEKGRSRIESGTRVGQEQNGTDVDQSGTDRDLSDLEGGTPWPRPLSHTPLSKEWDRWDSGTGRTEAPNPDPLKHREKQGEGDGGVRLTRCDSCGCVVAWNNQCDGCGCWAPAIN